MDLPPLSIYVHLPWCQRKCPYCDFNSHEISAEAVAEGAATTTETHALKRIQTQYLEALTQDLSWQLQWVQGRQIHSIFFGGGTPSLLSPDFYAQFLQTLARWVDFSPSMEVTLEANPGTLSEASLCGYRAVGINRLSIGIQSFSDTHLTALGRIHGRQEAIQAVQWAQAAGFQRINLDLMHGLPGQSLEEALSDLQQAIDLQPEHLSWYQLTLEPNTVFYRQRPVLPDPDTLDHMDLSGKALLAAAGFRQYEVSAFTRGAPCRHNLGYWEFADYLGLGAGAHGKVTQRPSDAQISLWRYQQSRMPEAYMQAMQLGRFPALQAVALTDQAQEFFMNVLRLKQGVPHAYGMRTALSRQQLLHSIAEVSPELLEQSSERWVCTASGFNFLNQVLMQIR